MFLVTYPVRGTRRGILHVFSLLTAHEGIQQAFSGHILLFFYALSTWFQGDGMALDYVLYITRWHVFNSSAKTPSLLN